jgi:ABC-2 type transport system permease protein
MPSWLQLFVLHVNNCRAVMAVRQLLTYGTIGADFWFVLFGTLAILVVFIPLTINAYNRKA